MTTLMTRLYKSHQDATAAVKALTSHKYRKVGINVVTTSADPANNTADAQLVDAIVKPGLPLSYAKVYADKVRAGATLLTVSAPGGHALWAEEILARFEPMAPVVPTPDIYVKAGSTTKLLSGESTTRLLHTKPKATLISGTIFGRLGIPELIKR